MNVGQGNSFIVKNSNIVITSNNINKAALANPASGNPIHPNNALNFNHPVIDKDQQPKGYQTHYPNTTTANNVTKGGYHQRAYSMEQKKAGGGAGVAAYTT